MEKLAALRTDIDAFWAPGEDNGRVVVLRDTNGYAEHAVSLQPGAVPIISLFNGDMDAGEISALLELKGMAEPAESIAAFHRQLDDLGFIDSPAFALRRQRVDQEYNAEKVRKPVCAGGTYPADPAELALFLEQILVKEQNTTQSVEPPVVHGLIVPHIDLRVGPASYGRAFNEIRSSSADLFIIFATSHYGWQDRFILTEKDFETPLGLAQNDRELMARIRERYPYPLTRNDIAHKPEHSIELPLVFLQYLFADRPWTFLPILVTSFHDLAVTDSTTPEHHKVRTFAETVRSVVAESGRNALYLSSGDLAHFGARFGDTSAARTMMDEVRRNDEVLLAGLQKCDQHAFLKGIAANQDQFRVCGTAPNYMLLETLEPTSGKILSYELWDDQPTESAVSFASLAFSKAT